MKIIVEVERRMEVCYGEANSPRDREPGMADSPYEANLSIIVSCRNLVAQLVGMRHLHKGCRRRSPLPGRPIRSAEDEVLCQGAGCPPLAST